MPKVNKNTYSYTSVFVGRCSVLVLSCFLLIQCLDSLGCFKMDEQLPMVLAGACLSVPHTAKLYILINITLYIT